MSVLHIAQVSLALQFLQTDAIPPLGLPSLNRQPKHLSACTYLILDLPMPSFLGVALYCKFKSKGLTATTCVDTLLWIVITQDCIMAVIQALMFYEIRAVYAQSSPVRHNCIEGP